MPKIYIQNDSGNPDIAGVMSALMNAYHPREPVTVTFKVSDSSLGVVSMKITALEYESGAPGMYNIRGYMQVGGQDTTHVSGFYNANRKEGVLEPTAAAAKKAG